MPDVLEDFVNFHATLKGDEKSESQIFLDRFFQACLTSPKTPIEPITFV